MEKELKNVKKILKELRYNGSFGVRGPRKTDQALTEESKENAENKEIEDTAIPA
jgi:hypothetical protein